MCPRPRLPLERSRVRSRSARRALGVSRSGRTHRRPHLAGCSSTTSAARPEEAAMTSKASSTKTAKGAMGGLDRYFAISARGSSWWQEVRGGFVTFFTMSYIVVLNPLIIGTAMDADKKFIGGVASAADAIPLVAAATALIAGIVTIAMGVIGKYPFALATGLGLNAFVAFGIAAKMTWADAMGFGGHRRNCHRHPGAGRAPKGDFQRLTRGFEDRHRRRHRPVHRFDRVRRRWFRSQVRRRHADRAGCRRQPERLADAGFRGGPDTHRDPGGPQGQGRHPDWHRHEHGPRDRH